MTIIAHARKIRIARDFVKIQKRALQLVCKMDPGHIKKLLLPLNSPDNFRVGYIGH